MLTFVNLVCIYVMHRHTWKGSEERRAGSLYIWFAVS